MNLLDNFSKSRILVLGDVMLDRYWWGSVTRISPEAPVPVVRLKTTSLAAGGAANVAANIAGLGAEPILVGIVGDDSEAALLPKILADSGVRSDSLITIPGRPTTVKTRVIAHSQQVARVDQETAEPLSPGEEDRVIDSVISRLSDIDAVVLSDYAKGLLTDRVISTAISEARGRGKDVLVDPKGKYYEKYRGASLLTPNKREAAEACKLDDHERDLVRRAGDKLMSEHLFAAVLITQGEEGMTLFREMAEPVHFHASAREVYDVTGAGDTVIATLAASIGAGADLEHAAELANIAAGLVVEQVGTTALKLDELKHALNGRK